MRKRHQDSKPSGQGKLPHVKIPWQARFGMPSDPEKEAGVRKEEEGFEPPKERTPALI